MTFELEFISLPIPVVFEVRNISGYRRFLDDPPSPPTPARAKIEEIKFLGLVQGGAIEFSPPPIPSYDVDIVEGVKILLPHPVCEVFVKIKPHKI